MALARTVYDYDKYYADMQTMVRRWRLEEFEKKERCLLPCISDLRKRMEIWREAQSKEVKAEGNKAKKDALWRWGQEERGLESLED
jgi:hypothetical protein